MKGVRILYVLLLAMCLIGCINKPPKTTVNNETVGDIWSATGGEYITFSKTFSASDIDHVDYMFNGEEPLQFVTRDPRIINELFDAVSAIEIGEETNEVADDYEELLVFYTTAQERYSIRFNMRHLVLNEQYYLITNDDALWNVTQKMGEVKE